MGKRIVPEKLRPPTKDRFGVVVQCFNSSVELPFGVFKIRGVFRPPKRGEYYWSVTRDDLPGVVVLSKYNFDSRTPRVIMDLVSETYEVVVVKS